jgi:hypothetical protein
VTSQTFQTERSIALSPHAESFSAKAMMDLAAMARQGCSASFNGQAVGKRALLVDKQYLHTHTHTHTHTRRGIHTAVSSALAAVYEISATAAAAVSA